MDEPSKFLPIDIPAAALARWMAQAERLAKVDAAVLTELRDLERDRTPWRLERCARAARWLETIADEPYRAAARALATELERISQK